MGESAGKDMKMRQKATKWTIIPKNTTLFRPIREVIFWNGAKIDSFYRQLNLAGFKKPNIDKQGYKCSSYLIYNL